MREKGKGKWESFKFPNIRKLHKGKREGERNFPFVPVLEMGYIVFKELQVWQKAMDLVEEVYKVTKLLPKEEDFGLKAQIRSAVVSVPSNIAEGNSRNSTKEYVNFLSIARGSNSEVLTQLIICNRLGYLSEEQTEKTIAINNEITRMLNAMIIKLSK